MKLKTSIIALALLAAAAIAFSCTGMGGEGGGGGNNNTLAITIERTDTSGAAVLNLSGPNEPSIMTVTYYIFGSETNFGGSGAVPLQHERLNEQQFGPLVYGDQLQNVDLSPWDQYAFVYLRSIGALPNLAFRIDPGTRYDVLPK